MGDEGEAVRQGMRDEPIIGDLQKRRNRRRFIGLSRRPLAYLSQSGQNFIIGWEEKAAVAGTGPVGEFIPHTLQFVSHFFDACDLPGSILDDQPDPEPGAKIEAIVQVFRLNEDIAVEQIARHEVTPSSRLIVLKVSVLETPSMRKASR